MVKIHSQSSNSPHPLAVLVGKNIVLRRKMRNLTQEELASTIGIGQQSLSRMERGHIEPQFERLQKLSEVLHCPVHEFFQQPAEGLEEKVATIKDILAPLTSPSQQAIINILAEMSREIGGLERKLLR